MAKQDNSMLWILLGVGAFFLFKQKGTAPKATAGTIEMTSPVRPTTTNRAPTTSAVSSGSDFVKWYQEALNYLIGANLAIDGIAGPLTKQAVMNFQQSWGLTIDGVIGPETEYYLKSALGMPGFIETPYQP